MESSVTILFVTYFSDKLISKIIREIDQKFKILIIENSKNLSAKEKLEKEFSNVKVIIPDENKGVGSAINLGLKNISTKYTLFLSVDLKIQEGTIEEMINATKNLEDLSILVPNIINYTYKKDFYLEKNFSNKISKMKLINGAVQLFNTEKIKNLGGYDENIFLYFEEYDLCQRCIKNNLNIYKTEYISFEHMGSGSIDEKFREEIELNRNWHYMWSTFYYYKKHFGLFYGLSKIFKKFFSSFLKFIFYSIIMNNNKKNIYKMRFLGILNSVLGKKSFYRPKINI